MFLDYKPSYHTEFSAKNKQFKLALNPTNEYLPNHVLVSYNLCLSKTFLSEGGGYLSSTFLFIQKALNEDTAILSNSLL